MKFVYSDGGRSNYFRGDAGDCVCRAICNATGRDYKEVYKDLSDCMRRHLKKGQKAKTCRDGVTGDIAKRFITEELGWKWHPVMKIGTGCTMHMREDELPKGTLIVSLSRHYSCVRDGVIYDTYDCSRDGSRCVYGYYTKD